MLLFASALLNPRQDPVFDAAVWIVDDRIGFAGRRSDLPPEARQDKKVLELGATLLTPGFVNAHVHLELTALEGLPYSGNFVAWIRDVLRAKQELAIQRQDLGMRAGILRCLRGGATTVGDHVSVTSPLEILFQSPLRGKAFLEVLGVVPEAAAEIQDAALRLRDRWNSPASRLECIPSPHSVHALAPELLRQLLEQAAPVYSIHLAESEAEHRYFAEGSGPMHDFIAERGRPLIRSQPSPVRELEAMGLLDSRLLGVHGNYLAPEEIERLASRGVALVHCPFSHRYFGHRAFPMEACRAAGLRVALGTDSLASAATLSMFEVMREVERQFPRLSREEIFAMASQDGAAALKLETLIGTLEAGKKADLIGVPLHAGETPLAALFGAESVCFSMIGGEIVMGF